MDTNAPDAALPPTIRAFLAAHAARQVDAAARAFSSSPTSPPVVVDDGHTYRGTEEVRRFLRDAGGQYTYTTELVGAERVDDTRWVAVNRIEGDFPGGVAELRFRFTLVDDRIAELVIAP
ncbi:nuclear transport factor 2-like protein [Nocardioides xinjiangensis]|uniref:nuclear transport factor 2 family protein n=1 Tax=Nocardioides xinjiangensis TaxID=2817376 RepID=UPI001B3069C7|nr:nuclear transport factor 2 family protein [Nocardioides sp. SYSU D00514]